MSPVRSAASRRAMHDSGVSSVGADCERAGRDRESTISPPMIVRTIGRMKSVRDGGFAESGIADCQKAADDIGHVCPYSGWNVGGRGWTLWEAPAVKSANGV